MSGRSRDIVVLQEDLLEQSGEVNYTHRREDNYKAIILELIIRNYMSSTTKAYSIERALIITQPDYSDQVLRPVTVAEKTMLAGSQVGS